MKLAPVVRILEDRCVNCHACITACPSMFCNLATEAVLQIEHDTCIGCGSCITACTHDARVIIDDLDSFLEAAEQGEKIVAIIAPSVASNFPRDYLRVNTWLRSLGLAAVFDVGFGAELTVWSYAEHIAKNDPELLIAQPCPAIVTYIELYRPELLPYLAPFGSPMQHTVGMIREFFPELADAKIAAFAPCIAKRREFDATGCGDYIVTFSRLKDHFDSLEIDLGRFAPSEYDTPPAERAVLFPNPGGLMQSLAREMPEIVHSTRKIEGPRLVYPYLDALPEMLEKGMNPLLIDCLNCEFGCNSGPGSIAAREPKLDELEWHVRKRSEELARHHKEQESAKNANSGDNHSGDNHSNNGGCKGSSIGRSISEFWKPGVFSREYRDLSGKVRLEQPSEDEIQRIFRDVLLKSSAEDVLNCGCCGYAQCRQMAVAIHNGLSNTEHCYVTQHKLLLDREKSIAEQESILTGILDVASEGYSTIGADGVVTHVNDRYLEIWHYSREDVIGADPQLIRNRHNEQLLDPDAFHRAFIETIHDTRPAKGTILLKDGRTIAWQTRVATQREGEQFRVWSYRDITEHEKALQQIHDYKEELEKIIEERTADLKYSEAELRAVLESSSAGIIFGDEKGEIVYANAAILKMLGYSLGELCGHTLFELSESAEGESQSELEERRNFLEGNSERYRTQMAIPRKDGELLWWDMSVSSIPGREEGSRRLVSVLIDITDRTKMIEALSSAKEDAEAASQAKSRFLAHMSHEIRTPLNGVVGLTELLLGSDLNEKQREYGRLIRTSGKSLLFLINDILDFSKIEAGKLDIQDAPFEIVRMLEAAIGILASRAFSKGLDLCLFIAPGIPQFLSGDEDRVRQVLINLISNAIKFTDEGGVYVRATFPDTARSEFVRFEIIDTGIGIPEDRMHRLFRSFSQVDTSYARRHGGTGLGLAISKKLIELMGGEIELDSKEGVGSNFYFTIPFSPVEIPPVPIKSSPSREERFAGLARFSLDTRKVLIASSSEVQIRALSEQFHAWKMKVAATSNREDTLSELLKSCDEQHPPLLILDFDLAEMAGADFLTELRADPHWDRVPIILLVPLSKDALMISPELSRFATLSKPVFTSALLDTVLDSLFGHELSSPENGRKIVPRERDGFQNAKKQADKKSKTYNILIAEDNPINQIVTRETLRAAGFDCEIVANGRLAHEAVAKKYYDLVLMDCQMPEMDGFEATIEIRRIEAEKLTPHPRVPIIALTANATTEDMKRCTDVGMDAFCSKPIDPKILIESIKNLIDS